MHAISKALCLLTDGVWPGSLAGALCVAAIRSFPAGDPEVADAFADGPSAPLEAVDIKGEVSPLEILVPQGEEVGRAGEDVDAGAAE